MRQAQFSLLFFIFLLSTSLMAQRPRSGGFGGFGKKLSGTTYNEEQLEFMKGHVMAIEQFNDSVSRGLLEFPLKIHIVAKSDGSNGCEIAEVQAAIRELNKSFLKANIRFLPLEDYNYIRDDALYRFPVVDEEKLCRPHDRANVINVYIVNKLQGERNSFSGYTHPPSAKPVNRLFITKKALSNGSTFKRQMGHFFGLYPTAGPIDGQRSEELVSGENCQTEGDQVCDTPADPGLDRRSIDDRCDYVGTLKDANRKFYKPMVDNIMSDNPRQGCRTKFSRGQLKRMLYTATYIRNYIKFPPPADATKKYLKKLKEKYGQEGELVFNINASKANVQLLQNLYKVQGTFLPETAYFFEITNLRKGFIYVFEGDEDRGFHLLYPQAGDQQYFKDEKKKFRVPTNKGDHFQVDPHGTKNYICILFSKKQILPERFLQEINELDDEQLNLFQRFYAAHQEKIVGNHNIEFKDNKIEFSATSTERYIVPIFLEYDKR